MEWHYKWDKPANYKTERPAEMIFFDTERYYIGSLNFDGKWFDYGSQEFKQDIEGWAYLPPEPIKFGSAEVVQEWTIGNGPVPSKYKHFLLYDKAKQEMVYRDIDSNYFDSRDRTFPEVSHYIALPDLSMHARNYHRVQSIKVEFLFAIQEKNGDEELPLEPFNEECLTQAIGEILNTTINGVRQTDLLKGHDLFSEIIDRWNSILTLWLDTSANSRVEFTFGTTKVPKDTKTKERLLETLKQATCLLKEKE